MRSFLVLCVGLYSGNVYATDVYYHGSDNHPPIVEIHRVYRGYPVRAIPAGIHFRYTTREGGIAHLSGGEHYGKFDVAWLNTLNFDQLESLHADDHQHKVKWNYVTKPQRVSMPPTKGMGTVTPVVPHWGFYNSRGQYCPNGQCPRR